MYFDEIFNRKQTRVEYCYQGYEKEQKSWCMSINSRQNALKNNNCVKGMLKSYTLCEIHLFTMNFLLEK